MTGTSRKSDGRRTALPQSRCNTRAARYTTMSNPKKIASGLHTFSTDEAATCHTSNPMISTDMAM